MCTCVCAYTGTVAATLGVAVGEPPRANATPCAEVRLPMPPEPIRSVRTYSPQAAKGSPGPQLSYPVQPPGPGHERFGRLRRPEVHAAAIGRRRRPPLSRPTTLVEVARPHHRARCASLHASATEQGGAATRVGTSARAFPPNHANTCAPAMRTHACGAPKVASLAFSAMVEPPSPVMTHACGRRRAQRTLAAPPDLGARGGP